MISHQILLQSVIWPKLGINAPEAMYFRATPRTAWKVSSDNSIQHLQASNSKDHLLDFSTFFGAFSLNTWCSQLNIDTVFITITFTGSATLRIWQENGYESKKLLWEDQINSKKQTTHQTIEIQNLKNSIGILYPQFNTKDDNFCINSIQYFTNKSNQESPKLVIVMPTFKRENYVKNNIKLLKNEVLNQNIKLLVIDNGKTLENINDDYIKIIQNKNYGGSGGFSRGTLEVLDSMPEATHILFCDDDVLIEPESIKRLYSILHFTDNSTIVPGGMMNMGDMSKLHEIGAITNGLRFQSSKSDLDLTNKKSVIQFNITEASTFYGWWFVCYPKIILEKGLPAPFFVGWDDVEFGFRVSKYKTNTIYLNGIAVWHDEFHKKEMNWRWYYHTRNGLIVNHANQSSLISIFHLIRQVGSALLTYRYERAEFMLLGAEDFIKGVDFIVNTNPEEKHNELVNIHKQKMKILDGSNIILKKYNVKNKNTILKKLLIITTFNGHLLPKFLIKNGTSATKSGWIMEDLHSHRLGAIFQNETVVYFEPTSGLGIICKIDRSKFFKLLTKLVLTTIKLLKNTSYLSKHWSKNLPLLTTKEFWTHYLKIE